MQGLLAIPAQNLVAAPGLSADACAAVEFLAIGAHAVRRAEVGKADTVLVIGAGPIGLGAALFARLAGAIKVALADRDGERVNATAPMIGVDAIIADDTVDRTIGQMTGGNGFDVVLDATGNQVSMQRGFDFVAAGGRYVLVSVVKDQITFSDPDFHRRELTLLGSRNATMEDFSRVISALGSGQVPLNEIVTHRTSLDGAIRDLPVWARQKNGLIKALIELGN